MIGRRNQVGLLSILLVTGLINQKLPHEKMYAAIVFLPLLLAWALTYPDYRRPIQKYMCGVLGVVVVALHFLFVSSSFIRSLTEAISSGLTLKAAAIAVFSLVVFVFFMWQEAEILSEIRNKFKDARMQIGYRKIKGAFWGARRKI